MIHLQWKITGSSEVDFASPQGDAASSSGDLQNSGYVTLLEDPVDNEIDLYIQSLCEKNSLLMQYKNILEQVRIFLLQIKLCMNDESIIMMISFLSYTHR